MPLIGEGEGRRKRKTQLWREGRGGGCGCGDGSSGERASGVCLMPPEENGRGKRGRGGLILGVIGFEGAAVILV